MAEIEKRDYFEAVEEFLREIQDLQVTSVAMVAFVEDESLRDVLGTWRAGPFELAAFAGILHMHAAFDYQKLNTEEEENNDE